MRGAESKRRGGEGAEVFAEILETHEIELYGFSFENLTTDFADLLIVERG